MEKRGYLLLALFFASFISCPAYAQTVKCWDGGNEFLDRGSEDGGRYLQVSKFCKCAADTYGYLEYKLEDEASGPAYAYSDTGDNLDWGTEEEDSAHRVYSVKCKTAGGWYATDSDYYGDAPPTTTSTSTTTTSTTITTTTTTKAPTTSTSSSSTSTTKAATPTTSSTTLSVATTSSTASSSSTLASTSTTRRRSSGGSSDDYRTTTTTSTSSTTSTSQNASTTSSSTTQTTSSITTSTSQILKTTTSVAATSSTTQQAAVLVEGESALGDESGKVVDDRSVFSVASALSSLYRILTSSLASFMLFIIFLMALSYVVVYVPDKLRHRLIDSEARKITERLSNLSLSRINVLDDYYMMRIQLDEAKKRMLEYSSETASERRRLKAVSEKTEAEYADYDDKKDLLSFLADKLRDGEDPEKVKKLVTDLELDPKLVEEAENTIKEEEEL